MCLKSGENMILVILKSHGFSKKSKKIDKSVNNYKFVFIKLVLGGLTFVVVGYPVKAHLSWRI